MARSNIRSTFLYVVVSIFFFASLYHHCLHDPTTITTTTTVISAGTISSSTVFSVNEPITTAVTVEYESPPLSSPPPSSPPTKLPIPTTTSILLPDWEVLVVITETDPPTSLYPEKDDGVHLCLFDTNEKTPAKFSGSLQYPERPTFTCVLPARARRRLPFNQPRLIPSSPEISHDPEAPPSPPLLRWSYLVYDSLTTDEDVVLFVKGINTRQGVNRDHTEFLCVFNGVNETVKTAVTSSMQEVFRCLLPPNTSSLSPDSTASVSIQIVSEGRTVPSVAYYSPRRTLARSSRQSLTCASTMVYNVAKFLKEWVSYYSSIGVDRFLLYDNGSDDDLKMSVDHLTQEGYDVATYYWRWPKTQEAGFSHSTIFARDSCKWMVYVDVDEFVYSPSWINLPSPDKSLLPELIMSPENASNIGQISINCLEFGPSDQKEHPKEDVMQGYDCRKRFENRHKSIVLLEAVDSSLLNAIHHFQLKPEYATRALNTSDVVVNHYKYQAWPEFKAKFRRRVSAYVMDWTQKLNPNSNDRTPGLGFSAIEPEGWPRMFCEVRDQRLKNLVRKWFAVNESKSEGNIRMSWQS